MSYEPHDDVERCVPTCTVAVTHQALQVLLQGKETLKSLQSIPITMKMQQQAVGSLTRKYCRMSSFLLDVSSKSLSTSITSANSRVHL